MLDLIHGLVLVLQPHNAVYLVVGVIAGGIFGTTPGLQNVTALSILLPFTYMIPPNQAFLLIIGIYVAGIFGGSITAIMYRIPGAPENMATAFDGFAMTQRGLASKALGAAILASALGGSVSILIFIVAAPLLANVALLFGPADYFALVFFALGMVALLGSSPLKAFVSVVFGLLMATVGISPVAGMTRFTFGIDYLVGGFDVIAVLVGVFAIGEVLNRATAPDPFAQIKHDKQARTYASIPRPSELRGVWGTFVRSTAFGTAIGIVPALGATAAGLLSYQMEQRLSPRGKNFGNGELAGVIAPEAANNASVGGAMIPLMTLGIPGSASALIMLAAFRIYGMQPGLSLFEEQKELVGLIYGGMLLANVSLVFVGLLSVRFLFSRIVTLPFGFLAPGIVILCTIGAYAARNNFVDVIAMFGFGVLGFLMEKKGFSVSVFVLAFILGNILENSFVRAMILADWNPLRLFLDPFAGSLIAVAIVMFIWSIIGSRRGPKETLEE